MKMWRGLGLNGVPCSSDLGKESVVPQGVCVYVEKGDVELSGKGSGIIRNKGAWELVCGTFW